MSEDRGSVELEGVTKRFGATAAVDRLDLEIQPGEFLSLLGPSGCGKTTTLRMLAGFEQPDEGWIRISGEYVQHVPAHKRDANTVFQHYALFPHMTVAENVAYGLRQRREDRRTVRHQVGEALEMVKMSPLANRVEGVLAGASHLGDTIQFVVRTGDGELLSRRPRYRAPKLQPGQRVWCQWDEAHVHLFPDTQAGLVMVDPAEEAAPA